jgi:uncharacterized protein YjbJ (UPF0337 family)
MPAGLPFFRTGMAELPWQARVDGARGALASSTRENRMNWNRIEGNWEQFKGQIQQQWGKLTSDDLDVIKGQRRELAGLIQERYGKAEDEADREIDDWLSRH